MEQIEQQIALIKTFAETVQTPVIKRRHAQDVVRLKARRQAHLLRLEKAVRHDLELARRLDLMLSIKGIGLRSALGLVIRLPELGGASRAEIAALAGVAPYDDDSGARRGRRRIQGGRERLRKCLFICAFTATRHPGPCGLLHSSEAEGKRALCAVIAVARKLIILANTIVIRDVPWTPEYRPN